MRRLDFRVLLGGALILLGGLMIMERLGLFRAALDIFWGIVFVVAGGYFLYRFAGNPHTEWWAAIPGFALAGLGAESLVPPAFGDWHGMFFLGALGIGFFAVYLSSRDRWWAILPGGVLVTLSVIAVATDKFGMFDSGALLFVGLGITFLLVAFLASRRWAYIPGVILLGFGGILGIASPGAVNLLWPAILILAGIFLIVQFTRRR
jgi:hypothetical protein